MLVSGQLQVFSVKKGISIVLKNPYKDEAVHYLQLWIRHASNAFTAGVSVPSAIDLDGDINSMASAFSSDYFTTSLGKFTGRAEGAYLARHNSSALFAFVIDGEMEVQYRLLQARDGLGVWHETGIVFKALSASAILLIAEVPKQQ